VKRIFLTLLILAVSLPLFAGGEAEPEAKQDSITFASSADVITLDPQNMTDNTSEQVTRMVYNNLITFDSDLNPVPDLAESWDVSADEKTWIFNLRRGVTYHDGTPFNAASVKGSFDRILDPANNLKRRTLYNMIVSVEVVDEYTVRITTNAPFGAFPATLAHGAGGVINPATFNEVGNELGKSAEAAVGTGPYKVVSWKKDQELVLEINEDYWGPAPKTRRIVYRPIPEASSRVIALETGEVDAISHIPANELDRLETTGGIVVHKTVSNGQRQFRFHCQKAPYTDPRVRQAIAYAIDRESITTNIMRGTAVPSTGALAPVTWGYVNLGTFPYDPAKARQLLAEAGYPDGFSTTISTTSRYAQGVQVAEAIGEQLRQVGIDAKIEVVEWSSMVQFWSGLKPEDNSQEIFIMGAGPSTGDADWGLRPIFRSQPTNENNYGYYKNAEFDSLIVQGMETTDQEKRKELYKRAQEIVYLEDPGAVWIYDNYFIIGTRSKLKDITLSPLGLVTFEKAYIE
jgi:peptide/nickel transport system substrate-binding protein